MNLDKFIEEAKILARRSSLLRSDGEGEPVGYWHGFRNGSTVASLKLDDVWLDICLKGDDFFVSTSNFPTKSNIPLFAHEYISLPPLDAIFLLGSPAIEDYLSENGWERNDGYNNNFPDSIPAIYEKIWEENCPVFMSDVFAVTGGWHFPWADGDFADWLSSDLVVLTLAEAEPWMEVFRNSEGYNVFERVT